MNGYKCFYRNKTVEVSADTTYEAQLKAASLLKAKKSWEVTVVLCEPGGKQYEYGTADL